MSVTLALARVAEGFRAADVEAHQALAKIPPGEVVLATVRRARNLAHHRKMFALFQLAYSLWNPAEKEHAGMPARKSFTVFRRELVVAAGYYETVLGIDGQVRLEAESLNFGAMGQERFSEIYENVVQVLLSGMLAGMTRAELDRLTDLIIEGRF